MVAQCARKLLCSYGLRSLLDAGLGTVSEIFEAAPPHLLCGGPEPVLVGRLPHRSPGLTHAQTDRPDPAQEARPMK